LSLSSQILVTSKSYFGENIEDTRFLLDSDNIEEIIINEPVNLKTII